MSMPILLAGAALLFWGWQTGHWIFAIIMALSLEARSWAKTRWEFSEDDFSRVWDLCTILFFGGAIVAWGANGGMTAVGAFLQADSFAAKSGALNQAAQSAFIFVQWLPIVFFPMSLAQAWSTREKIDFIVFSWWLRRQKRKAADPKKVSSAGELNIAWAYFAIVVISASAVNGGALLYYAATSTLVLWACWRHRSPRYSLPVWAALALAVVALGYLGHTGLHRLQKKVENWQSDWMTRFNRQEFGSDENRTAIGQVGRLKLSGRIVLRVKPAPGSPLPPLLRDTSHNIFRSPVWSSSSPAKDFGSLSAEKNETTWLLLPERESTNGARVTISRYLKNRRGLLALPLGAERIDNLAAAEMRTNRLGTAAVLDGPGLATYQVSSLPERSLDSGPDLTTERPLDLEVPMNERDALQKIAADLKLRFMSPPEAVRAVERFFQLNFQYSTWQGSEALPRSSQTALSRFLLNTRSGHCEYFATATVLLLRTAGIPARYALGWSVQERSGQEFVVRGRHAHAWCLAWVNDAWHDLDTTPGSWLQAEEKNASLWEPFSDFWSQAWFQFQKFRWGKSTVRQYVPWVLLGLLLAVTARLFWKSQWKRRHADPKLTPVNAAWPGLDSEFFEVEHTLADRGFTRHSGETFSAWLIRLNGSGIATDDLPAALELHNRYRFDPRGLAPEERAALRDSVSRWKKKAVRLEGQLTEGLNQ